MTTTELSTHPAAPDRTVVPAAPRARVRDALHETWRSALVVHPGNENHVDIQVALRAGLTVLATLALVAVAGHHELAGFAALGAIVSVYGRLADPVGRILHVGAAGLLQVVTMVLASAVAWGLAGAHPNVEAWVTPVVIAVVAALACAGTALLRTGAPGATLVVFAAAGGLAGAPSGADVARRGLAVAFGVLVAVLVVAVAGARTAVGRRRAGMPMLPALPPAPAWHLLALRVGVGSLLGAVVAQALGLGHPGWAALGATAVLQGRNRGHVVVRGLHRGLGTAAGAAVAWLVLGLGLGYWPLVVVVAALQVVTELVVVRHYALAMLTITPMALLMSTLGAAGDPTTLATDRAIDTILGVVAGVVALLVIRPRRTA